MQTRKIIVYTQNKLHSLLHQVILVHSGIPHHSSSYQAMTMYRIASTMSMMNVYPTLKSLSNEAALNRSFHCAPSPVISNRVNTSMPKPTQELDKREMAILTPLWADMGGEYEI